MSSIIYHWPTAAIYDVNSKPVVDPTLAAMLQAAFLAAGHEDGKENSAMQAAPNGAPAAANGSSSPGKAAPKTWEAFCRAKLSSTAAQAVLRASSR